MLQLIREKTSGWIATVILVAVTVPFLFFGINNYFSTSTETYVAKVGEVEISPDIFRARFQDYRGQVQRAMGEAFDPEYFDQPLVKRQFLERLIDEEVLVQANTLGKLVVSDSKLSKEIQQIEAFKTAGKFDVSMYQALLSQQQMSPKMFEERVRRELATQELTKPISATSVIGTNAVEKYIKLRDQLRDFSFIQVNKVEFADVEEPTAPEIQAYFDANIDSFRTEELIALEYVELDLETIQLEDHASDEQLKERYEERKASYIEPERRLASHILVAVKDNASAGDQSAALEKANSLLSQLKAGADFSELARKESDDIGSKASGGDLGWLEPNVTEENFDLALFSLEKGVVSDPVQTSEGYHLISLQEIQSGTVRTFEDVRDELERDYFETERERRFADKQSEMVDIIYRDPNSLQALADSLGLKIQRTELFARNRGLGIAANPAVLKAAFSDIVLANRNVSDPIELPNSKVVAIRALEHKPRIDRALDEVSPQIILLLKAEKASNQEKSVAQALVNRLGEGVSLEAIAAELKSEIIVAEGVARTAINYDQALVKEIFRTAKPVEGKEVAGSVRMSDTRFAVFNLRKVIDADLSLMSEEQIEAVRNQLADNVAQTEYRAMLDSLRSAFEVKIAEDRI